VGHWVVDESDVLVVKIAHVIEHARNLIVRERGSDNDSSARLWIGEENRKDEVAKVAYTDLRISLVVVQLFRGKDGAQRASKVLCGDGHDRHLAPFVLCIGVGKGIRGWKVKKSLFI